VTTRLLSALFATAILLTASGCPPLGVGEACTTSGDGFTKKDPCAESCVDWEITCPNGVTVVPDSCSGEVCGASGSCPSGQVCVQIDSFVQNSRCMAVEVCGVTPVAGATEATSAASEMSYTELPATSTPVAGF